ncbi:MAG: NAD(P)H-dependent oxidoreductase [Desulfobacterales bacterium]|nr:NAD(P)H-dependent oxidoreductase [Desulfobacterales bacterium]
MAAPRVLINVFHPNLAKSRANRLIVNELRQLPGATVRDIQKAYPDWKIDVAREQELLLAHDLVVFQHPFYWYSCPALMKLWMDEVLTQGFAYPPGVGDSLRGKAWLSSITTGGPWEAYRSGGFNNWTISELQLDDQRAAAAVPAERAARRHDLAAAVRHAQRAAPGHRRVSERQRRRHRLPRPGASGLPRRVRVVGCGGRWPDAGVLTPDVVAGRSSLGAARPANPSPRRTG